MTKKKGREKSQQNKEMATSAVPRVALSRFPFSLTVAIIFFIIAFAVYRNVLGAPFIWDDRYLIAENHFIRNLSYVLEGFRHHLYYSSAGLSNFYRPLQTFFLATDYLFWKDNPFGYHLTSLLFHALCAFFAYVCVYILFKRRYIAAMVGLLFLVHPINSTVVDYISSRADTQVALFSLMSLYLFFRSYRPVPSIPAYIGALVMFVFALLSKELAIIHPFLLAISIPVFCEYTPGSGKKELFKRTIPFFILLAVYVGLRATVLNFPAASTQQPPSLYIRLLTTTESFVRLMGLLFVPAEIHIEKNIPFSTGIMQISTLVSVTILCLVGAGIYLVRRYSKMCSFGLIWFFVALIPMANIRPINATIADHWLYLPCIGFFLAVIGGAADALNAAPQARRIFLTRILIFFYISATVVFAALTVKQNGIWAEPVAFYRQALKYSPQSFRAHNEIGIIYLDQKKLDEAIEEFKKALEINPAFDQAYDNLGIGYDLKNDYNNAIRAHEKALSINPYNPKIYNNLGNAYNKSGRYNEAIAAYQKALKLNPSYKAVYNNIAVIYYKKEMFKEAREYWERALRIDPNFEMAKRNLEVLNRRLGK